MNHILGWKDGNHNERLRNQDFESRHKMEHTTARDIAIQDFSSLESMIEQDVRRFHKNSKNDVIVIYDLSQEVFYRQNTANPGLTALGAALFLFFKDFMYYLNMEEQQFIPSIKGLLQKKDQPEFKSPDNKPVIQELIRKIRLEHDASVRRLIYFKVLSKDYVAPVSASKPYRLFLAKLKKFAEDLTTYIHLENRRIFPLAIELELYLGRKI